MTITIEAPPGVEVVVRQVEADMAQARPPLAYLGELARRPATQEEIGYRQMYDATYGDPTAPQQGMYLPKVGSYGEIQDQLYSTGLQGTPTPATADEYGNLYAEHANAQRSALAALGFDASRVTPSPDPGARFPLAGAYSPQTDALFVNSYAPGPKTVGSHEGMHRGVEKLKEARHAAAAADWYESQRHQPAGDR